MTKFEKLVLWWAYEEEGHLISFPSWMNKHGFDITSMLTDEDYLNQQSWLADLKQHYDKLEEEKLWANTRDD